MKRNVNLNWNVFRYNINAKKIEPYNVFTHGSFLKDVLNLPKDKYEFKEQLRRHVQYYFWSKCEMEVVITSWPVYINHDEYKRIEQEGLERTSQSKPIYCLNIAPTVGSKIDIYEQLMLNWDMFVEYTWNTLYS
jgi:hypothetical protein